MKLKYYLRGLGIGVLVTTLILSIAPGEKETLSDAEIRERASALGMVDSSSLTLTDVQGTPENTQQQEPVPTESEPTQESTESEQTQESMESEQTQESTESEPSQESQDVQETVTEPEELEESANGETVTIVIERGSSSYTVSKILAKAGLIKDAKAFDTYLCDNGYSRNIVTGTYEIAPGTSEEEIAKIITEIQ